MRSLLRRKRGIAAVVCVALVAVLAMAPVASCAFTCVLVLAPALFALVAAAPVAEPSFALTASVCDAAPPAPRGPPSA